MLGVDSRIVVPELTLSFVMNSLLEYVVITMWLCLFLSQPGIEPATFSCGL